jgi:hypothetical protein
VAIAGNELHTVVADELSWGAVLDDGGCHGTPRSVAIKRRQAVAPMAKRACWSRMSITHATEPSARVTWVPSICHKSLGA